MRLTVKVDQAVHRGLNLRSALSIARHLGCRVDHLRRTGEIRVEHAISAKSLRLNGRRKDTPRVLVSFLRRVLVVA